MLLSEIIEEYKGELLDRYSAQLLPSHFNALNAMKDCRTQESLLMKARCGECQYEAYYPHSCGHRFCPHCQHHESQQWIERQRAKLLPIDYFMITFTLPAQLRPMARLNQKVVYSLLFTLAWETLKRFGLNDGALKGLIGATAVLHTHSRALNFHPHVHFIIPAGAIDKKHNLWREKNEHYLFNHKNLATVFRAKWIEALKTEELRVDQTIPDKWVVDCQHVGRGDKALTYLGKYLYRGVLPEKNIIRNVDGEVTFCYTDNNNVYQTRKLAGADFLWLLLQHVLPRGFRRARDFGFLHANCKRVINLLHLICKFVVPKRPDIKSQRAQFCCAKCGGSMNIVDVRIPRNKAFSAIVAVT